MASKQVLSKYAAQSAFVFIGKVVKLKAATVEGITTDDTAVVQVEQVITAPDMFASLAGTQITVRFKKMPRIRKGSTLTLYTNGWIFGESIAVDAVGFAAETRAPQTAKMVRTSHVSHRDAELQARLDSAEMGVVGKVANVVKSDRGPTHISEHDPNWHEATIDVDEVVKGKKNVKRVTVLFPQSDDIRWFKVAKYKPGQQGIWIMQKGRKQDPKGIARKVLDAIPPGTDVRTTLHPADYLPLSELGRVKALLRK
jgi:hypothetical protein